MAEREISTRYVSRLLREVAERLEGGDLAGLARLDMLGGHIVAFSEFHDPLVVVVGLVLDFCAFGLRRGLQLSMIRGMFPDEIKKRLEGLEDDCKRAAATVKEIADLLEEGGRAEGVVEKCAKLIELGNKYVRLAYHVSGIRELRGE